MSRLPYVAILILFESGFLLNSQVALVKVGSVLCTATEFTTSFL